MQGEGFLNRGREPPDPRISSRPPRQPGATIDPPAAAGEAYDRYAAVYDTANADNDYEMWLGAALLPELETRGLRKGWALDVGCGTGRAFEPLLQRGWRLVGCDASPGMLARAAAKFGEGVALHQADARNLPALHPDAATDGGFQLVLMLNDVLNYVTETEELGPVFRGVRRNLDPEAGLCLFDVNTLTLFREDFTPACVESGDGWEWRGLTGEVRPGGIYEARLEGKSVESHIHRQRHWTSAEIEQALRAAGLAVLARLGQREENGEILLAEPSDESRDRKIVYIVRTEQP